MATTTKRRVEPAAVAAEPEPIDTSNWPPISDDVKAAHLRMLREPHLFDDFGDDDWVAFSGDEIVASGPDLDDVLRAAEEAGKEVTLIVPTMGGYLGVAALTPVTSHPR